MPTPALWAAAVSPAAAPPPPPPPPLQACPWPSSAACSRATWWRWSSWGLSHAPCLRSRWVGGRGAGGRGAGGERRRVVGEAAGVGRRGADVGGRGRGTCSRVPPKDRQDPSCLSWPTLPACLPACLHACLPACMQGPTMAEGQYAPAFPLKHQQKDMRCGVGGWGGWGGGGAARQGCEGHARGAVPAVEPGAHRCWAVATLPAPARLSAHKAPVPSPGPSLPAGWRWLWATKCSRSCRWRPQRTSCTSGWVHLGGAGGGGGTEQVRHHAKGVGGAAPAWWRTTSCRPCQLAR